MIGFEGVLGLFGLVRCRESATENFRREQRFLAGVLFRGREFGSHRRVFTLGHRAALINELELQTA